MIGDGLATQPRKLHPFFAAPKPGTRVPGGSETLPGDAEKDPARPEHAIDALQDDNSVPPSPGPAFKRRKKNTEEGDGASEPTEKRRRGRPRKSDPQPSSDQTIADHFTRKAPADSMDESTGQVNVARPENIFNSSNTGPLLPSSASILNADQQTQTGDVEQSCPSSAPAPRKVLKLNLKTGTIGSLPKPRTDQKTAQSHPVPRPRSKERPSLVVTVKYGHNEESRRCIGTKIDQILTDNARGSAAPSILGHGPSNVESAEPPRTPKVAENQPKETHPFFLAKGKTQKPAIDELTSEVSEPKAKPIESSVSKMFTSTPCSPKRRKTPACPSKVPQFGIRHMGMKIPGSRMPAWPWQGVAHIGAREALSANLPDLPLPARKSKGNAVRVPSDESIMTLARERLGIAGLLTSLKDVNSNDFLPPPPELRLPQKHFESGPRLQKRMASEIQTRHPALQRLYSLVGTSLTAADRSECESSCWNQKYAPVCASEVIQSGREAYLLKDWLQALTVQSVDTGQTAQPPSGGGKAAKGERRPRKKRKSNKLDGFVVSSDEEEDELVEVSDSELDWSPSGRHGLTRKTVIRTSRESKASSRLTNAVVISGPQGCGKTAAVYAVAKELGFEVFEINPSSRRSGRDVLEKIGDMTRNHLVQHHQTVKPASEGSAADEEEVARDIQAGRQATMNSFFKARSSSKKSNSKSETPTAGSLEQKKTSPSKHQKQSLILLEEVDILYEEDKQFWQTVVGLIIQSKRPVIMTCNDETLIPLQTLDLHGILRFTPPPTELAVDCLLMIAACEGHALRRQAVQSLYDSRHHDLRAALTELNYWCQLGVGDRRGGFDWFYLRWPKGVDLDDGGHVIRVISEDTYQRGMGWIVHDCAFLDGILRSVEEELLEQTWDAWHLDISDCQDGDFMQLLNGTAHNKTASGADRAAYLKAYEDFADAMSVSDITSADAFTHSLQAPLDPTVPDLSEKTRDDYIIGLQLLETCPKSQYDDMERTLTTSLRSLARRGLCEAAGRFHKAATPRQVALDEERLVSNIHSTLADSIARPDSSIRRIDMSLAFDPIAAADPSQPATYLDPSVFDRTMEMITVDVAPYVRSIVAYDSHLTEQRLKLSNLLSQGGSGNKRMRKTRAAYSALEGSSRSTTRAEKWFKADLNPVLVMQTGGKDWGKICQESMADEGGETKPPSESGIAGQDENIDELA